MGEEEAVTVFMMRRLRLGYVKWHGQYNTDNNRWSGINHIPISFVCLALFIFFERGSQISQSYLQITMQLRVGDVNVLVLLP